MPQGNVGPKHLQISKIPVSAKQDVQKTVKADKKLCQCLLNVLTAGKTVQLTNIQKHELSPFPLSLINTEGEMNSTTKEELISI